MRLPCFAPKAGTDRKLSAWVENLENILNESKTEQVCYDFKMGLCQITGADGASITKVINKIVKTLAAMTNTKPGDCYVVVGVADKESDATLHDTTLGGKSIKYNDFFITGIDAEAKKFHKSIADLEQKVAQQLDSEPISPELKTKIKANVVTFSYEDKEILLFKATRGAQPELYDNVLYTRTISHIEKVDPSNHFNFFKMFERDSALAQKNINPA